MSKKKCYLTEEQIKLIPQQTIGQASNENWLIARKDQLTGGNFGKVLAAVKRNRYPPSLFKSLTEGYDISSARAVQWGKEHEPVAVQAFTSSIKGAEVIPSGLWLYKCGFLGASPDGFCGNECIVEVEIIAYKYRNCSLSEALKHDRNYGIYKENNETKINYNHAYYHQIQGQLHLSNRILCYLIVGTLNECEVVYIEKNEEWTSNL